MLNRETFLKASIAAAGLTLTSAPLGSQAADEPALGNFPAGIQGNTAFIGFACPLTGSYSADGQDLRRGYELAVEDLNNGTGVMAKIPSLAGKKGLLGKQIIYKVADSETNPNIAVQHSTEFISQDKAIMFSGGVASSEVIAMEKLGQQQKVIFMSGASVSNDTTGKDCQRYGFRSEQDAYMVAKALAPVIVKALGRNRKAIYLTPDYTYGHSMTNSMREFTEKLGWQTVGDVVAPFPTSDYSSFLTNIAASGADTFLNSEYGNDGIASTKQAAQFGILKKMKLVVPNLSGYFADGVGAEVFGGVYGTCEWLFPMQDRFPLSKLFVQDFQKKYNLLPRFQAHIGYTEVAYWANAVARAKTFYPVAVIKELESGQPLDLTMGKVYFRAEDHQMVRPVPVVIGKKPSEMTNKDDFLRLVELVPGADVMQPLELTGCTLPGYT
jgi:branched-chain amino acid transport system substrate-binding protein